MPASMMGYRTFNMRVSRVANMKGPSERQLRDDSADKRQYPDARHSPSPVRALQTVLAAALLRRAIRMVDAQSRSAALECWPEVVGERRLRQRGGVYKNVNRLPRRNQALSPPM